MLLHNTTNDLNEIEKRLAKFFSELLAQHVLITNIDEDAISVQEYGDEYFDYRNEITGNCIEVHVIHISENGILVVESQDTSQSHTIRFSDLASIEDRLHLCKLMEDLTQTK